MRGAAFVLLMNCSYIPFCHFDTPFCHFDRSVVFSLALAQNRGFCAKEERQRSEVARRVYAACLERSLPRRARGEISERQRRTRGYRPRKKTRPYILCKGALPLFHFTSAKICPLCSLTGSIRGVLTRPCNMVADSAYPFSAPGRTFSRRSPLSAGAAFEQIFCHEVYSFYYYKLFILKMQPNGRKKLITSWRTA